ncbi:PKD domain-containing protein [Candidatus Woesearchaeota archaeon]|nr:PKD domain-containing protein [Candidatus Woesearchaeota archaeon]
MKTAFLALFFVFCLASAVNANLEPSAVIYASTTEGEAPLQVIFMGIGIDPEGESVTYIWDFGDGTTSASQMQPHTFMTPGTYYVSLDVFDSLGQSGRAFETIEVKSSANQLIATIITDKLNANIDKPVVFSAHVVNAVGSIDYSWEFDGIEISNQATFAHSFNAPGTYIVSLRAVDQEGREAVDTVSINIKSSNVMPSVSLSANPKSGNTPLTVTANAYGYDPEGESVTYFWDFGDGSEISGGQSVAHVYDSPGTYVLSVTVADPHDNMASAHETINVIGNSAPIVIMSASKLNTIIGDVISFSASGYDPEGDDLTYEWDFGDGATAGNQQNVVHSYNTPGTYPVVVTVRDSQGNTATATENIIIMLDNLAPSVVMTASPESGEAPLTVIFNAYGYDPEEDNLGYEWDFDDGSIAFGQTVIHTFNNENSYEVRVKVEDSYGNSDTAIKTINVGPGVVEPNMLPTAIAMAEPDSGYAPLVVSFTGIGEDIDGEVISYYWDFGDGYSSDEQNPVHVYNYNNTYNVQLTVTDDKGATGTASVIVTVEEVTPGPTTTFDIQLRQGWNLISLPLRPADTSINSILAGVNYNSVWRKSGGNWQSYLNGLGGEFDTIEADRGYWIYANADDVITVTGTYGGSVSLNQGWNLAGYTTIQNQLIQDSLSEIDIHSIWRWNANTQAWESYLDEMQNGEFTTLEPGRGYWIYADNSGSWTY